MIWPVRGRGTVIGGLLLCAVVSGACGDDDGGSDDAATEDSPSSSTASEPNGSGTVDLTALPLGDGKVSDAPAVGFVYSCNPTFGGGGALAQGPWIDTGAGTWDATEKVAVEGDVEWPAATWDESVESSTRVLASVDLPVDHTTGVFPVEPGTEAYDYDRNPNAIGEHAVELSVPSTPTVLDEPRCIGGEVGIMTSGVLLFNAFDAGGRDAVATEVQDHCDGHPQAGGYYHYHGPSDCREEVAERSPSGEHSPLEGYAFDGFGIFGVYGEDGTLLSTDDLDECHGHTHSIEWDGQDVEMYHYHLTPDFPYSVGCFRAEPAVQALAGGGGPPAP